MRYNEDSKAQDLATVAGHITALMEHFDTVQIFCTRYDSDDGGTVNVASGKGNYFARKGHIEQWLEGEEEGDEEEA